MLVILALLVGYVSATSDNCAYFSTGYPLDECYYVDASYLNPSDSSGGYFCRDDNDNYTEYTVTFQEYQTTTCSGDEGYSFSYTCSSAEDALLYCNCGGSPDYCSTVTQTLFDCDDTTDGTYYSIKFIIDLCLQITSTTSASYALDSTYDYELVYSTYGSTDCSGDNINTATSAPTFYSCTSRSDCGDWCSSYYTLSSQCCGATSITLFGAAIIILFSMIF